MVRWISERVPHSAVVLFLFVLLVSMVVFYTYNQQLHSKTKTAEYAACLADRQLATNQRRVILALLALAQAEFPEGKHPVQIEDVRKALALVPSFDCRK